MALAATANIDLVTLLTGGNYPADGGDVENAVNEGTSNHQARTMAYYDRLDVLVGDWNENPPAGSSQGYIRVDPLFQTNTGTLFGAVDEPGTIGGDNVESLMVGEWDRQANTQKMYVYRSSTNNGFHEVNPLALNVALATDVFPNFGPQGTKGSGPGVGVEGHVSLPTSSSSGQFIFFETWGYAVCCSCSVVDSGLVMRNGVMALVDLSTGFGSILASPVAYGTQSHQYALGQLFGQNVDFQFNQFVPDDISTPLAPRGRIFMSGGYGSHPTDSGLQRLWVKVIDWNPLDVSGTPNRVHLRELLLSAIDLDKGNPSALDGVHPATNQRYRIFHHPRTARTFLFSGDGVSDPLVAGEQKVMFLSSAPVLSDIVEPSAKSDIVTGRTTEFSSQAVGTLQEPIGGVGLQATLQRESTVDEVLAVTPTPGETVTLANTVNPTDPNLSPIVVKKDGVPLVETTNYSLNRGASQITFVSPEPVGGSVYTATYRHFGDPQSPPHGTLQNQNATTDETGEAVFRVSNAEEDPVDDRWDRIDVTAV